MKLNFILIIFILAQNLFAESDFSIALRGGNAIGLYSGLYKWEYDEGLGDNGLTFQYISKPIIVWSEIPVGDDREKYTVSIGVKHFFYINPYMNIALEGEYWKDKSKGTVNWRGPNRKIRLGFTDKFEVSKKINYFFSINRIHYNSNFSYSDATSVYWSINFSLNRGFSIVPWLGIWKEDKYDTERGLGLSFSYKFILN